MTISSIIIFLSILFLLVTVHELGHFLIAKYFKIRVDEFAFGFPPRLLSKKYGETTYSFNLIPLGGYVKIFGENGLDEEEIKKLSDEDRRKLFTTKAAWKRILVLSGGVVFNILAATLLFAFAFTHGTSLPLEKDELKNIPAEKRDLIVAFINEKSSLVGTGVSLGDKILKLEAEGVKLEGEGLSSQTASEFIQAHNNSKISISILKNGGQTLEVGVIPKAGIVEGKKVLGASFSDISFKKYSFWQSIPEAFEATIYQLQTIFTGVFGLLHDVIFGSAKVEDNLSGPVGLAIMTTKVSERGLDQILIFAAMLSLSLAVFNILPIPALDGGRIFFVCMEVLIGRKVKASTEQLFHGLGFLALLCLMIFVTYFDIVKALT